jgi:hypothetical protein
MIGEIENNTLIAGGLYSVTALRKTGGEVTVYTEYQELKQTRKQASQPKHESLVATEAISKFFVFEESGGAPRARVPERETLVLTFCINSTRPARLRGRSGSQRLIRALGKETGTR